MFTFHYIVCELAKKNKHHIKKIIFNNKQLDTTEDMYLSEDKLIALKRSLDLSEYTSINEDTVNELIWILEHKEIYTAGTSFKENEVSKDPLKITGATVSNSTLFPELD